MDRIGRSIAGVVVIALSVALHGCAKKHSPQDSTETGNPPVIDADRVALVVEGDEVHVVGENGAVEPGGATIRVRNLVSDKNANGRAAMDGSFDISAPGEAHDGFSVQASNGDAESKVVIVTQGGAVAVDGSDGSLSCEEQTNTAYKQLNAALDAADDTCTDASDCVRVGLGSVCTDGCVGGFVSDAGMSAFGAALSAVEHGLCAGFRKQGCHYDVSGCPIQPGPVMCLKGHCALDETGGGIDAGSDAGGADPASCVERSDMAHLQLDRAIADADRNCSADDDCTVAPSKTDCFENCSFDVVSTKGETEVQDDITAINAGLCAGYADGCGFTEPSCKPPPTPACKQGQCIGMFDVAMCDEASSLAQTRFDQASADVMRTCTQNSDCSYAPLPTCANPNCSITIVSNTSAAEVQAIVDQINQDVCAPAEAGGCSYQSNGTLCMPPAPQCTGGTCQ
jgi:hypothetical protein